MTNSNTKSRKDRKSKSHRRISNRQDSQRVNVTFSVSEHTSAELRKEAHLNHMTISQKINSILQRNISFQRPILRNNGLLLPAAPVYSLLISINDEERAAELVQTGLLEVASRRIADNFKSLSVEELIHLFKMDLLWIGFYTDFTFSNNDQEVTFVFSHDFGSRWSGILAEGLSRCMKELIGNAPAYRIYPASVVFRLSAVKEVTEILNGTENAVRRGVKFMSNVRKSMDLCYDGNAPSIVVDLAEYKEGYLNALKRGAKIRVITEINDENLLYCKQLQRSLVSELRHIDGVKGGMAVSESEYMATISTLEGSTPLIHVIYSNMKQVVSHHQFIFDVLWATAEPAAQRIDELERKGHRVNV